MAPARCARSTKPHSPTEDRPRSLPREDPIALYRQALARRLHFFDLARLIERINASDIELFIDNGFGATRGKYERPVGGRAARQAPRAQRRPDYLFGGKSREPSVRELSHAARCDEVVQGEGWWSAS